MNFTKNTRLDVRSLSLFRNHEEIQIDYVNLNGAGETSLKKPPDDDLKVSQPPWSSANAAPIYPEKIPVSLMAQPLSPKPLPAGTNYLSMEGATNDNERDMTQGEMMKGLDAMTRRYARPIAGKYTAEQLKAQVGKETGVIFIAVPIEWVAGGNTPGNRQQIANRVGPLLGQALCCRVGVVNGKIKYYQT